MSRCEVGYKVGFAAVEAKVWSAMTARGFSGRGKALIGRGLTAFHSATSSTKTVRRRSATHAPLAIMPVMKRKLNEHDVPDASDSASETQVSPEEAKADRRYADSPRRPDLLRLRS